MRKSHTISILTFVVKFSQAVEAYKMFLIALGYSEHLIEAINYENRNQSFK